MSLPGVNLGRILRVTTAFLLIAAAVTQFQNCGGGSSPRSRTGESLQYGGGGGYDGKMYATIGVERCPNENSFVRDRVVYENNHAIFLREDCREIPAAQRRSVPAVIQGQTVRTSSLVLNLEAVPPTLIGEFTSSELGNYAPAVFVMDFGPTWYFRSTVLGPNLILAVGVDSGVSPSTLKAKLYGRNGMFLTEQSSLTRPINFAMMGDVDEMNPFSGYVPFADQAALLFVQQGAAEYKGVLLRVENGALTVDASGDSDITIMGYNVNAQALDANRALVVYRRTSDRRFAFRVLTRNQGDMSLGPEFSGTGAPFGAGVNNSLMTFMPAGTDGYFAVFSGEGKLSSFHLQINGEAMEVSALTDLPVSGIDPGEPVIVGTDGSGYLMYTARFHPDFEEGRAIYWARLTAGAVTGEGGLPGMHFSLYVSGGSSAGGANLLMQNQSYFLFGAAKIIYLAPANTGAQKFTVELSSSFLSPAELAGSAGFLIGTGIKEGHGYVSVISAPQ